MDDNQNLKENQPKNEGTIFRSEVIDEEKESPSEKQLPSGSYDQSTESPPLEELPPDVGDIGEEIPNDGLPPNLGTTPNYFLFGIIGGIIFILIFFIIFKFLTGRSQPKKIELTYWGLWDEKEVFQALIEEYQRQNKNVSIKYEKRSPENYREKLISRINNGIGPDIFRFHNTWLPEIKEIVSYIPKEVMSNEEFEKTFYPVHQKDLKVANHYYGIPLYIDGLVLVYNKKLFDKAGVLSSPSNWDEIIDVAAKLMVKDQNGEIITSGIALGTANNIEHFSDILGLFILQNGGDLTNFSNKEGIGALQTYRQFAEPPNNFWSPNLPNSLTAFIQEKVAMIFVPSWVVLLIKSANPELDLKVIPVPDVPGGKPVSIANYWVEGVSIKSKNQIEAWKFLKFLVDKKNLPKLFANQSKIRLFGTAYSRVDLANLLVQHEYLSAVIKQASYYQSLPLVSKTFDNGLNDEIIKYLENAVNSTNEGVSYSEAAMTAQKGIEQVYSKFTNK